MGCKQVIEQKSKLGKKAKECIKSQIERAVACRTKEYSLTELKEMDREELTEILRELKSRR